LSEQIREILINEQERNACLGIRDKRIKIPAWLPMMGIVANEAGSNG